MGALGVSKQLHGEEFIASATYRGEQLQAHISYLHQAF